MAFLPSLICLLAMVLPVATTLSLIIILPIAIRDDIHRRKKKLFIKIIRDGEKSISDGNCHL